MRVHESSEVVQREDEESSEVVQGGDEESESEDKCPSLYESEVEWTDLDAENEQERIRW